MDDQNPSSATVREPPQSLSSDLVLVSSPSAQNKSHEPTLDNNTPRTLQDCLPSVSRRTRPRRTFHKFNCLPLELKCLIWDYSYEQRMVEVRLNPLSDQNGIHDFVSTHHNPSVLHTNKESRNHYLGKFIRLGNSTSRNDIYFHPEIDIIYIRNLEDHNPQLNAAGLHAEEVVRRIPNKEKIKNLAGDWWFAEGNIEGLDNHEFNILSWAFHFPSLKRLFRVEEFNYEAYCFGSDFIDHEHNDVHREINFGDNLTEKRTYFTAIGHSSFFNEDHNDVGLSLDMVSHFLEKRQLITCRKKWERMLEDIVMLGGLGEPWTSAVAPPIEEFYDVLAFTCHIPAEDYYCY
ncbi:hypothetical protein HYALB_00012098 [Hymenoscyphus albidus]|uniref:2EXR domain-containing protein n=1 Tax=Hymenoscyphus albidus TaxID=595503 RepID=A0A9N9LGH2_9HELO|nr:hypothetical protein HYALB_00012098 [Hymenoscyphus albidus]